MYLYRGHCFSYSFLCNLGLTFLTFGPSFWYSFSSGDKCCVEAYWKRTEWWNYQYKTCQWSDPVLWYDVYIIHQATCMESVVFFFVLWESKVGKLTQHWVNFFSQLVGFLHQLKHDLKMVLLQPFMILQSWLVDYEMTFSWSILKFTCRCVFVTH